MEIAQTLDIHVVTEEFLDEILNDRPSNVMEKLKISTWGILPAIRKQPRLKSSGSLKSFSENFFDLII